MNAIKAFIRFQNTLHQYPQFDWDDETISNFNKDKKFWQKIYEKNRVSGFGVAAEKAHLELFKHLLKLKEKTKSRKK